MQMPASQSYAGARRPFRARVSPRGGGIHDHADARGGMADPCHPRRFHEVGGVPLQVLLTEVIPDGAALKNGAIYFFGKFVAIAFPGFFNTA